MTGEGTPHTFYYVYIIKNNNSNKLYIGSTNNLRRRLEEHQKGKVFSNSSKRIKQI